MSTDVTYMPTRQAKALCATPQRAAITATDAWGNKHSWIIEWQPETVDADSAQANVGRIGVLWADWCPVTTRMGQGGTPKPIAPPVSVSATYSVVRVPVEVESAEDMGPGCWRVVE